MEDYPVSRTVVCNMPKNHYWSFQVICIVLHRAEILNSVISLSIPKVNRQSQNHQALNVNYEELEGVTLLSKIVTKHRSKVVYANEHESQLRDEPCFDDYPLVRTPILQHHHLQEFWIKYFLLASVIELISQNLTKVWESITFLEETSAVDHFDCNYSFLSSYLLAVNFSIEIIKDVSEFFVHQLLNFISLDIHLFQDKSNNAKIRRNF